VLLTGQADHQDTIRAINDAGLDWYISKPWQLEELQAVVVRQLTDFVVDVGLDPLPYVSELDGARLMDAYARRGPTD
jgi:two-component system chemotaxis response regulator CheY